VADELRKVARVVDMGMRKDDGIESFRVERNMPVLFESLFPVALVKTAVKQDFFAVGFN
jgi:hypothetical protein